MGSGHVDGEPESGTQREASLVVFVDDRVDPGPPGWLSVLDVLHECGHQYVAGLLAGREATALPRGGQRHHMQVSARQFGSVSVEQRFAFVRGEADKIA